MCFLNGKYCFNRLTIMPLLNPVLRVLRASVVQFSRKCPKLAGAREKTKKSNLPFDCPRAGRGKTAGA